MTELITRPVAWMVQQAATFPDTVVMKTVTAQRGWFETVTGIASGVMTVTVVGLTIFLAPAAWSFWRTFRKVRDLLDKVYGDVMPIARHGHNIADNLDYITTSIRSDVQQVNATIASANRRLQQAVELTEKRMNEFNALLQVVQQEAEQAFVSTAAAVRGVRTGAAAFSGLDAFDEAELATEEEQDDDDDESNEIQNGDERGPEARPTPRPRLRSQRRRPV
jgi:hypothetical protein